MIKKFETLIDQFCKYALVICVLLMLFLTLMNIAMRWFEFSLHWVDPLVRHLVFISAFLGGTLAIGTRHHIKIDLLGRIFEHLNKKSFNKMVDIITTIVSIIACVILTMASVDLAAIEFEFGKTVFLGIHSGVLISIIPFGMGLMSIRFFLRMISSLFSESLESGV